MTHEITSITPTGPTTEGRVAHLFGLRGDTWMRHANPRSVWTRFTCVSLVVIAVFTIGLGPRTGVSPTECA